MKNLLLRVLGFILGFLFALLLYWLAGWNFTFERNHDLAFGFIFACVFGYLGVLLLELFLKTRK